jgi:hypothetical protein
MKPETARFWRVTVYAISILVTIIGAIHFMRGQIADTIFFCVIGGLLIRLHMRLQRY